jgi:hypothetical protein
MSEYRIISQLDGDGVEYYRIEEKVKCFFKYKWITIAGSNGNQPYSWEKYTTVKEAEEVLKHYMELQSKKQNFKPEIHEYNPGDL